MLRHTNTGRVAVLYVTHFGRERQRGIAVKGKGHRKGRVICLFYFFNSLLIYFNVCMDRRKAADPRCCLASLADVGLTPVGRAAAPRCPPRNRTVCASARCSRSRTDWWPGRQQSPVSRSLCKLIDDNLKAWYFCNIYFRHYAHWLYDSARRNTRYFRAGGRRSERFHLLPLVV